jgi:hypothetical protein
MSTLWHLYLLGGIVTALITAAQLARDPSLTGSARGPVLATSPLAHALVWPVLAVLYASVWFWVRKGASCK